MLQCRPPLYISPEQINIVLNYRLCGLRVYALLQRTSLFSASGASRCIGGSHGRTQFSHPRQLTAETFGGVESRVYASLNHPRRSRQPMPSERGPPPYIQLPNRSARSSQRERSRENGNGPAGRPRSRITGMKTSGTKSRRMHKGRQCVRKIRARQLGTQCFSHR